jgi:hypothetical protein
MTGILADDRYRSDEGAGVALFLVSSNVNDDVGSAVALNNSRQPALVRGGGEGVIASINGWTAAIERVRLG